MMAAEEELILVWVSDAVVNDSPGRNIQELVIWLKTGQAR